MPRRNKSNVGMTLVENVLVTLVTLVTRGSPRRLSGSVLDWFRVERDLHTEVCPDGEPRFPHPEEARAWVDEPAVDVDRFVEGTVRRHGDRAAPAQVLATTADPTKNEFRNGKIPHVPAIAANDVSIP